MKMRKMYKTSALLLTAALAMPRAACGYDFTDGTLFYNTTSDTECEVSDCISGLSGSVVIPQSVIDGSTGAAYSVTSIGDLAFYKCFDMTSVSIPNSVTSIGDNVFYSCSGLRSVTIPNSVTSIGGSAFEECSKLASIDIPNSVTSISDSAFAYCDGLTFVSIPNSVTSIGDEAFYHCEGLRSMTIGNSVRTVGFGAFAFTSIDKLTLLPNTPPEGLGDAFRKKGVSYYYSPQRTYVANGNYSGNDYHLGKIKRMDNLSSMFEAGGVKYVPVSMSDRTCEAIDCTYSPEDKDIVIGPTVNYKGVDMKVTGLNPYLLSGNTEIKTVDISAPINAIPARFAAGCDSLTSATIGNSVDSIGWDAFRGSGLMSIVIPASVTYIADGAFYDCDSLTRFTAENGELELQIGDDVFHSSPLQEVRIGRNLVYEYSPFRGCASLKTAELTNVPTEVFENEFRGCASLEKVVIGDGVTKIGDYAFSGCTSLASVTLPEKLDTIGADAFSSSGLTSVVIPASITSIGDRTFYDCDSLRSVNIPNSVTSIGADAFRGSGLTSVAIPASVTYIANGAFYDCGSLTRFTAEDGERELRMGRGKSDEGMFRSSPLQEVRIGRNLVYNTYEDYGYSPFYRIASLKTAELTDVPTEVLENEFYGCTSLEKVVIGDGVTKIGDYAFSGCTSLGSFSFGAGVDSIGDEAFSDCTAMTELYAEPSVPPACGAQALDDIRKWDCTLYVPAGALEAYKGAEQWKEFLFVKSHDFETSIGGAAAEPEANGPYRIYGADGSLLRSGAGKPDFNGLPKGIYIVNGRKVLVK